MIDGQAASEHLAIANKVRDEIAKLEGKEPGGEEIFGKLSFSHDIIHQIGGQNSRLTQLHVSEVNSASQHDPITYATKLDFQSIAHLIPAHIPLIVESRLSPSDISKEIDAVLESLPSSAETAALLA